MICSGAAFDGMEKLVLFLGFGHKIDLLHHQFETLTPSLLEWLIHLILASAYNQITYLGLIFATIC